MPCLAYCGIDCETCSYRETVNCKTCREYKGDIWHGSCAVAKCVLSKGLDNCGECDIFPCKLLIDYSYDAEHGDDGLRIRNLCQHNRRAQLGNSNLMQIGILVNDVEQAAKDWADFLGVPVPNIIITDTVDKAQTLFNGQSTPARSRLAFLNCGQLDIELIEPDKNPSIWRECLDKDGEGFHHIAFIIKGMKDKINLLEKQGMKCVQTGEYTGGRYAYVDDAQSKLKLMLELLEND